MSRRIDVELTSDRGDGTWTWRAVGAKQPKGVVAAGLLSGDPAVGQQLRADVETTLDGTEVLSVAPPKAKNRAAVETIDLLPRGTDEPLVTQTLAKRGGGSRDRGDRGDRPDRGSRGDRGDRGSRGPRRDGESRGDGRGGPRADRGGPRPDRDRDRDPDKPRDGERSRSDRPRRANERPEPPAKPKAKRLRPARAHRKVALDALAPEERVLGEILLQGGLPAVRSAVERQNAEAKAEGGRKVSAAPLLAIADRLHPPLRVAEWRDRAEAAIKDLEELDLRDLRSVVVGADSGAKDDETLLLASQLREGLGRRLDEEHTAWLAELAETVREGRAVRALRLSSRPPKAGAPLPADLATSLAEAASAALTADTLVDRWATVLDAVSFSPVRLTVVPASKPEEPKGELIAVVTRMADRVPKVAEAFGIDPSAAPKRGRGGRSARSGGPGGRSRGPKQAERPSGPKPVPPKPPKPIPPKPDLAPSPATELASPVTGPDVEATPAPATSASPVPRAPDSSGPSTPASATEAEPST
ncbi:MAG: hypothetical protein ACR2MB_04400 [Acidimicrobiales bacterium]